MGDNYCDAVNNRAFCNYDGGDCCQSTVKTKKVSGMLVLQNNPYTSDNDMKFDLVLITLIKNQCLSLKSAVTHILGVCRLFYFPCVLPTWTLLSHCCASSRGRMLLVSSFDIYK